jgi:hypothetical protein
MMKGKYVHISLFLILIALTACGPAAETVEPAAPKPEGALEVVTQPAPLEMEATTPPEPAPQLDAPESYPSPPTAVPLPEGYPAPQPQATINPYPEAIDGFIWMLLPVGIQCEDDSSPYADLAAAVAGLTAVNVQTGQSETTELMVCSACGCPTSAHFRVQVSVADVNAARILGWEREG